MRTKRTRVQADCFTDSETAENPPPTTTHHHTDYSVGAGVVKAKRFVYHAKPAPHPRNTPSEDNTPVTPVIGFPQPFDPSDSHHLVPDVLELEKTRRRTAGVCLFESPTIHTHVKQDLPFLTWLPERDAFIKEFLWHEAAADDTAECPGCMEAVAGSYCC